MATKTDGDSPSAIYHRQRSNSDPQPAVEVLSTHTLNTEKGKYNTLKEKAVGAKWKDSKRQYDQWSFTLFSRKVIHKDVRRNGEMKSGSLGANTPPPERKSKFAALGKIFKPWKWKRKKKSEKIEKTVVEIERKISMRTSREELIRKGVLKEQDDSQQNHLPKIESVEESAEEKLDEAGANVSCSTHIEAQPTPNPVTLSSVVAMTTADDSLAVSASTPATEAMTMFSSFQTPTMTTVADISPHPSTSINTSTSTVTSTQSRPVIVPPVVPPVMPPPPLEIPPQTITLSSALPPPQVTTDSVQLEKGAVQFSDSVHQIDTGDDNEDEPATKSLFEAIPASEPDLRKLPKKSALKMKNGEASPIPTSTASISDLPTSSLKRPVETVAMMHPAVVQTTPRSSPQLTPNGRLIARPRVTVRQQVDQNKENVGVERAETEPHSYSTGDSDSSDDDEIKYRDDDDDVNLSSLAAKVARQDSLARFLSNRPSRNELVEKNIILEKSDVQKLTDRVAIGSKLTRRLSLRPTLEDLEQRNIIHHQTDYEKEMEKEEKKRFLIRKLSFRPSIEELRERKIIKFNDYVELTDAEVYDRRADKPWTRLTPKDKAAIRKELNEFKSKEMEVHEDSKHLTRFHRP